VAIWEGKGQIVDTGYGVFFFFLKKINFMNNNLLKKKKSSCTRKTGYTKIW
jgi:hypothetical protein